MADGPTDPNLLARRIAGSTAIAWVAGVVLLSAVAMGLVHHGNQADLDHELRVHAAVAYGLAWFSPDGQFHDELLRAEPELLAGAVAIAVATPEDGVVFGNDVPRREALVRRAMRAEDEVWRDVDGLRILAYPAYDDTDRVVGAVLASTPVAPAWGASAEAAGILAAMALLLTLFGLVVSRFTATRILGALNDSLAEREQILAGAAHELRTPMSTLRALLETTPQAELPDIADALHDTVDRSSAMVERLLTWSRLARDEPQLEKVRLDLLVEVCLHEDDVLDAEDVVVTADPRLVEVAVRNLVHNARIHGDGLDRVVVRPGRVEVWDRGEGIPADHVVAPFHRGPRSRGSGLGLALVSRIAERHGGRLMLRPVVCLELPVEG